MLVRDRMTSPAVTVRPDSSFQDALSLMRERRFRRLPVVDDAGKVVGIVSERDLLHAAPSPATSLSVWEVNYLLWKLRVSDVMTEQVITVPPDMPIEDAAQILIGRKIGGLPVVDEKGEVIGVITETDIFKAFSELLSGGEHGMRLLVRVPVVKGTLARITQMIADLGGDIVSLGTFEDKTPDTAILLIKVQGVEKDVLATGIGAIGYELVDARPV